jgi:hypothetical protein
MEGKKAKREARSQNAFSNRAARAGSGAQGLGQPGGVLDLLQPLEEEELEGGRRWSCCCCCCCCCCWACCWAWPAAAPAEAPAAGPAGPGLLLHLLRRLLRPLLRLLLLRLLLLGPGSEARPRSCPRGPCSDRSLPPPRRPCTAPKAEGPTMMSKEARQIMMAGMGEAGLQMWKVRARARAPPAHCPRPCAAPARLPHSAPTALVQGPAQPLPLSLALELARSQLSLTALALARPARRSATTRTSCT